MPLFHLKLENTECVIRSLSGFLPFTILPKHEVLIMQFKMIKNILENIKINIDGLPLIGWLSDSL